MISTKSIVLMLISIVLFAVLGLEAYASSSFSGLETQIHSESSTAKIKKMQLALSEFNLYSGQIDGNYDNVKDSLIAYQKNTGISENLGYFGVKTLTSLKEDFPDNFTKITEEHLKMDIPSTDTRFFYVTAYYSPLPDQKRYTTGTYEGDIKLNGAGKNTASGKQVFEGILAAPRNYYFGTKIEFAGLGVGVVEDRGGAIVNSGERGHEYDRIDIWMGYGDEGLLRALKWGQRKVQGKIVPSTRELSIEFDTSIITKYKDLVVDAEKPVVENVKKLQNLLTDVKIYTGVIDGNFNSVKEDLIKYQVENNIISSRDDNQAGYFGDKTYAVLREKFASDGIFKNRNNKLDEDVLLSQDLKDKLDKVNVKITALIDKKYGKNTPSAIKYRLVLRNTIELQTKKERKDLRKNQLKYLKSII